MRGAAGPGGRIRTGRSEPDSGDGGRTGCAICVYSGCIGIVIVSLKPDALSGNLVNRSAAIHWTLVIRDSLVVPLWLTLVYRASGVTMDGINTTALLDFERFKAPSLR
jgi:hypothetical protein